MEFVKSLFKSPSTVLLTVIVGLSIFFLTLIIAAVKIQTNKAQQQIANMKFTGILSIITVIVFGLISESYIKDKPELSLNYIQLLLYLAMFFSLMSLSMCTIAPVSKEPSTDKTLWNQPLSGLQWWGVFTATICLVLGIAIYKYVELNQLMLKGLTYLAVVLSLISLSISTEHKLTS